VYQLASEDFRLYIISSSFVLDIVKLRKKPEGLLAEARTCLRICLAG